MRVRTFGELAHDIFRFMADWMRDARLQSKGKASPPNLAKIKSEIAMYASKEPSTLQFLELYYYSITPTPAESRLEHVIEEGLDIISPTTLANHIQRSWLVAEILYFKLQLIFSASTTCCSSLIMFFDNLSIKISMHIGVISALQGKNTALTFETVLKHATFDELEDKSFTTLREHHSNPQILQKMLAIMQETQRASLSAEEYSKLSASYSRIGMKNAGYTANCAEWLVNDRKRKISENSKRGKESQAKGNYEARERAKSDMEAALAKVRNRVTTKEKKHGVEHGSVQILEICRKVCSEFKPLSPKKNAFGKFENCEVLKKSNGEPVKPETLAKHYRKKFGTKKAQKKMPHK